MSHLLKAGELKLMFANLAKFAAIGLFLPIFTVDCEQGFSVLTCVRTNLRKDFGAKTTTFW